MTNKNTYYLLFPCRGGKKMASFYSVWTKKKKAAPHPGAANTTGDAQLCVARYVPRHGAAP